VVAQTDTDVCGRVARYCHAGLALELTHGLIHVAILRAVDDLHVDAADYIPSKPVLGQRLDVQRDDDQAVWQSRVPRRKQSQIEGRAEQGLAGHQMHFGLGV
jgi:hypothetical protein